MVIVETGEIRGDDRERGDLRGDMMVVGVFRGWADAPTRWPVWNATVVPTVSLPLRHGLEG